MAGVDECSRQRREEGDPDFSLGDMKRRRIELIDQVIDGLRVVLRVCLHGDLALAAAHQR